MKFFNAVFSSLLMSSSIMASSCPRWLDDMDEKSVTAEHVAFLDGQAEAEAEFATQNPEPYNVGIQDFFNDSVFVHPLKADWGWHLNKDERGRTILSLEGNSFVLNDADVASFEELAKRCSILDRHTAINRIGLANIRRAVKADLIKSVEKGDLPSFLRDTLSVQREFYKNTFKKSRNRDYARLISHFMALLKPENGLTFTEPGYRKELRLFIENLKHQSSEKNLYGTVVPTFFIEKLVSKSKKGSLVIGTDKKDRLNFCIAALKALRRNYTALKLEKYRAAFEECEPLRLVAVLREALNNGVKTSEYALKQYLQDHHLKKGDYEQARYFDDEQTGHLEAYVADMSRERFVVCAQDLQKKGMASRPTVITALEVMVSCLTQAQKYYGLASKYDSDPYMVWNWWGHRVEKSIVSLYQFYWNNTGIQKAISKYSDNPSLQALMSICGSADPEALSLRDFFFESKKHIVNDIINCESKKYTDLKVIFNKEGFQSILDPRNIDQAGNSIQHIWYKTYTYQVAQNLISIHLVVRVKKMGEMTVAYTVGNPQHLADWRVVTEFAKVARIGSTVSSSNLFLVEAFPKEAPNSLRNPDINISEWFNPKGTYELGCAHFKIDTSIWN